MWCILTATHAVGAGGCESDRHEWDSSCEAYTPVLNSKGDNVVIGAVAFEGYLTGATLLPYFCAPVGPMLLVVEGTSIGQTSVNAGESAAPGKVQLPSNTFALYIAGQYNKKVPTCYLARTALQHHKN